MPCLQEVAWNPAPHSGRVLLSPKSCPGDSAGFDPKVGRAPCWGRVQRGAETRQGSPVERVSGSHPAPEACGVLFGHLPMNLTEAGFTSSSKGSSGIPPGHPLCWLSMLLPQGRWEVEVKELWRSSQHFSGQTSSKFRWCGPSAASWPGPGPLPRGPPQSPRFLCSLHFT